MLGGLDIRSVSVNIFGFRTFAVTVTMRALVGISVGWTIWLVALEEAGSRVPRVLLALHQLSESRNARGHAECAKSEIRLSGTFNILRPAKSGAATARLVERISFASVDTSLDGIPPWRLRTPVTVVFSKTFKVTRGLFLGGASNIFRAILGQQTLESAFSAETSVSWFLFSCGSARTRARTKRESSKGTHRREIGIMGGRTPGGVRSTNARIDGIGGAALQRAKGRGRVLLALLGLLVHLWVGFSEISFATQQGRWRSRGIGLIAEKSGVGTGRRHGIANRFSRFPASGTRATGGWGGGSIVIDMALRIRDRRFATSSSRDDVFLRGVCGRWLQRGVDRSGEHLLSFLVRALTQT
jgi:hypothetical protein